MSHRRQFLAGSLAIAGACWAPALKAQAWPSRPIRIILPFPAGGTGDGVLRAMQGELSERLGQPLVMENLVGGTGMVGQDYTMRQPPDGHTFVVLSISGVLAYHQLGKTVNFVRDLTPVAQIYSQYGLIVSNPSLPGMQDIRDLRDLIAYARAHPGRLNYGSQGTGSIGHLVMERVKALTGIHVVHIAYRGPAPGYSDLMGGHIQLMSTSLGALPYIRSGRMRALAVGAPERVAELPEVPTFIEQGLSGYIAGSWLGLAGPPSLPAAIVERMSREIQGTLKKPDVLAKLRTLGTAPEYQPPAEFAARVQGDFELWGKLIRDNNIRPD
jgi:tripartite-type tricarboxylate transporter receptor subunit TctC